MDVIKINQKESRLDFDPTKQISSDRYKFNITLLSFLASLLAGAVSYLSGILAVPIGKSLHFASGDLSFIALINVALIVGGFLGSSLISVTIRKFTARGSIIISAIIAFSASIILAFTGLFLLGANASNGDITAGIIIFTGCVFLSGLAFGNLNSCGTFLMIGIHRKSKQDDKWVTVGQGAFGVFVALFGFLSGTIVSQLTSINSWYVVYFIISAIALTLIVISYLIKTGEKIENIIIFSGHTARKDKKAIAHKEVKSKQKIITTGVILAAAGLWFYMMTENTGTFWLGSFIANQDLFQNNSTAANSFSAYAIAMFWTGMTFGRLVFRLFLKRSKDIQVIFLFTCLAIMCFVFLSMSYVVNDNKSAFYVITLIASLLVGCSLSVIYPAILNLGIKQSFKASPLNQAIITASGYVGAGIANVIFFLVAENFSSALGDPTAYALPIFYASGTILIAFIWSLCCHFWRIRSKLGLEISEFKGSACDNLNISEWYYSLKKEHK